MHMRWKNVIHNHVNKDVDRSEMVHNSADSYGLDDKVTVRIIDDNTVQNIGNEYVFTVDVTENDQVE